MKLLVATQSEVLAVEVEEGRMMTGRGLEGRRPTCLAADPYTPGRAWCGAAPGGVFRTDDGGASWNPAGLQERPITALAASLAESGVVWAGTEPSQIWRSGDGGATWERTQDLERLPSSSEWSFPPRPDTHHVRWIACHPSRPGRLWIAVEAGALVSTLDGGHTWQDRVPGGPWDTHELAIHPAAPETLRVAAGDGYFESSNEGASWASPRAGLEVTYLRSIVIAPGSSDIVIASAASRPRTAYVAGSSDGRLYRRLQQGPWHRVRPGWPDPPVTIAALLLAGGAGEELWAADERGLHQSSDAGSSWEQVVAFPNTPHHLRGFARLR